MKSAQHPTRQRLLDAAYDLLDQFPPDELTVNMVLSHANVSIGSLYHHFGDFPDLLESAMVLRFSASVNDSIATLQAAFDSSPDQATFIATLREVTTQSQSPTSTHFRFRRARLLALAEHRPRLRTKLAREQARVTAAFAEMFRAAQQRNWFNRDFDPVAAGVLVQAYTLGKLVDEVTDEQVDPDAWIDLVMQIVTKVFAKPAP